VAWIATLLLLTNILQIRIWVVVLENFNQDIIFWLRLSDYPWSSVPNFGILNVSVSVQCWADECTC
jgi:hypothetical protein